MLVDPKKRVAKEFRFRKSKSQRGRKSTRRHAGRLPHELEQKLGEAAMAFASGDYAVVIANAEFVISKAAHHPQVRVVWVVHPFPRFR